MKIFVFYHADCPDGFAGAAVANLALGKKANYQEINYADRSYLKLKAKKIYFIDIAPELEDLKKLEKHNEIFIIDHHPTREKEAKYIKNGLFSLNNSGATLAFKYFFPNRKMPTLLKLIERRDLWKIRNKKSLELLTAVDQELTDFKSFQRLLKKLESAKERAHYKTVGKQLLKQTAKIAENAADSSIELKFEGHRARLMTGVSFLRTQIGAKIYEKYPCKFSMVLYLEEGKWKVTMRAKVGSNIKLNEIAAKYGGGGHRYAAGFHLPLNKAFPWKYY